MMEPDTVNKLIYTKMDEAIRLTLEKCIKEQRMTKDYFDSIFKKLYEEQWKNIDALRGVI